MAARDLSNGGIRLASLDLPKESPSVGIRFRVPPGALPEGFDATIDTVATVVRHDAASGTTALRFERPLDDLLRRQRTLRVLAALGFLAVSMALLVVLKQESVFYFWFNPPIFLYGLCATAYLVSRLVFASFYAPFEGDGSTPTVTIVIPCFNEKSWIQRTVVQCLDQSYPPDRLEVILVDDGSTDGSSEMLARLAREFPRVRLVRFDENRGKRDALAAGVRMSKADLVVFVDSDSFLEPLAIRNIVKPFSDPGVAGVCGHCDVENKWTNELTRMQAFRYYFGFRIMKAAESVFDAVTCLSGPLACYRRSTLLGVLDGWLEQRFLGARATFGDDRSLTNCLLPRHKIVYQSTARCLTIVPSKWGHFIRQQMRWKRSWLRESLRAALFMWRKQPFMTVSFYLGLLLPLLAPFIVFRSLFLLPLFSLRAPVMYLVGMLAMAAIISSVYLLIKRSNLWFHGVTFCFVYLFVLLWQMPVALVTLRESRWGTR